MGESADIGLIPNTLDRPHILSYTLFASFLSRW